VKTRIVQEKRTVYKKGGRGGGERASHRRGGTIAKGGEHQPDIGVLLERTGYEKESNPSTGGVNIKY